MIRATINELPPMAGCQRIRMALRPKGILLGEGTVRRMVRELGLMVVRGKGRSKKRYEPLVVDGPRQILVADTTTWWVGRQKIQIYASVDAYSRYSPPLMVAMDRIAESTVDYYGKMFTDCLPAAVHTDNGKEFDNRNTFAYLEERSVMWRHGPSHTPEAQGLVERFIRTLADSGKYDAPDSGNYGGFINLLPIGIMTTSFRPHTGFSVHFIHNSLHFR